MATELHVVGQRIRRLRTAAGLGQVHFASQLGVATGTVSRLENGGIALSDDLVTAVAAILDCSPSFLIDTWDAPPVTRPWLRAYADAPKRIVDRQIADCELASEVIHRLALTRIPDTVARFTGDHADDAAIEDFAVEVREAAGIGDGEVVANSIRAAERLGCLVLPMSHELGRHLGMSMRADLAPVICVSRTSTDPTRAVPGDRQRFTVAHELGHLALHSAMGPPRTSEDAARIEREAHRFAGAFLAPADALTEALGDLGGRVTLRTLSALKQQWGLSIKALVARFRSLGVVDEHHARSLYKQISARGWNTGEPVPVGNEQAIWLTRALTKRIGTDQPNAVAAACGLGPTHIARWTDWAPTNKDADVVDLAARRRTPRR